MSRAVVLFLVVVAVAFASAYPEEHKAASKDCGPNEVFNACGTMCPGTCEKAASPICTMACNIGCECKSGFVRNKDNMCVLTRDC